MDILSELGAQTLELDGLVPEYGLTQQGDPICLSEYANDILNENQNTHIVLCEDFSTGMGPALIQSYLSPDA